MGEKKKRMFRFNVIDIVIILIVICAAGSVLLRYNLDEKISISGHSESVEIKFLIKHMLMVLTLLWKFLILKRLDSLHFPILII